MDESKLPEDRYSKTLSRMLNRNEVVAHQGTTINVESFLGHQESWIVRVLRTAGEGDTVFLQRISVEGALRIIIPPEVTASILRQGQTLERVNRRRAAKRVAAERKAAGVAPAFLKNPHRGRGTKRRARKK